jgi:hypothetical protein
MTAADLLALFEAKATAPPPESSQMLVRHLDTVETTYSHEFNAELLYELGAALVREGLGGPEISSTSLLVALKEHDATVACFDEESQYMMEGSAEPALGVVFCPREPVEVRRALLTVSRFVAFNCELFQLVEALAELC